MLKANIYNTSAQLYGLLNVNNIHYNPYLASDRGIGVVNDSWSLSQACDYCLRTRWKDAANPKSVRTKINTMINYFGGDTPITAITPIKIDGYVDYLRSKYKAGTVNLYLNGLSAVLRTAYDRDMLAKMPKIPQIKNRAKRIRFLSRQEESTVLEFFCDDEEMHDAVCVLLDTGMRKAELFSLCKDDVDLSEGIISLWETKTGAARSIPMTERVAQIMSKRILRDGKLFDMSKHIFFHRWEKMRLSCGFGKDKDFVPHILRHTCCSRLVQAGAELIKVSKWMGHATIDTTMIYAHLSPNSLREIKGLLETNK